MERGIEAAETQTTLRRRDDNPVGEILYVLEKFTGEFKSIRHRIIDMDDEELVALYQQAKEISNVSWLIRAIVMGTAKERSKRGDGVIKSLAREFGIGQRMAEMDIKIYETFIKNNPDFEPELPPIFYLHALKAPDPDAAIDFAVEQRTQIPGWPSSDFNRYVKGEMQREPAPRGYYLLTPVSKADLELTKIDNGEGTDLYGKVEITSIGGSLYCEVK